MNKPRNFIHFLAESVDYKVYAICESVYLKNKNTSKKQNDFCKEDIFITWHYGDPNDAIILASEKYIIVSGCGLTIYDIEKEIENHILEEPNNIVWTNGLHQDEMDDPNNEFRFIRYNDSNNLRVYKMNVKTLEQIEIE